MRKTGQWHTRPGRGEMAEYPLTARERLRMKRAKAFTEAQDRLTGFDEYNNLMHYDLHGSVNPIVVDGVPYYVTLKYDDTGMEDEPFYEVTSKDSLESDVDRGDWCRNPTRANYREDVLVLCNDLRLKERYAYYQPKLGKAWAWSLAVLYRNASLQYARKQQERDVTLYGVIVENEQGLQESLWGVDEDYIIETVRELINQF